MPAAHEMRKIRNKFRSLASNNAKDPHQAATGAPDAAQPYRSLRKMLSALRNFAITFVIAALIFGMIAYFIVGFVLDTLTVAISGNTSDEPIDADIETVTLPPSDETTNTPPPEEEPIEGETFNILLIGTDYQPKIFDDYDYESRWTGDGFPDHRSRKWTADMLILMRVDKENRKFIFCALPSSTRVMVDGIGTRLGDIYPQKGIEFLCGKVTGLTGLPIDYYAVMNADAIKSAIDTVGGISYYVPEDMNYEDPDQDLVIDLKKGTSTIDGAKAVQLLRYRGYVSGDVGRMNTCIGFLEAVLAKFTKVTYVTKTFDLYKSVSDYMTTSFTSDDLTKHLDLIFAYSKFEQVIVNYPGSTKTIDGEEWFEPSINSAIDIFDSYK